MRADLGWIFFAAFVLWLLQALRSGGRTVARGPEPRGDPSPTPGGTQREGAELEQLLRHLERRLGQSGAKAGGSGPKVVVTRSAPPLVPAAAADQMESSLENTTDPEITEGDHEALDPKMLAAPAASSAVRASPLTPTARQLRDAVVWQEVLGPPKALQ